jgi:LEA14-like dessication related protein
MIRVRRLRVALLLLLLPLGGCWPLFEKPRVHVSRVNLTSVSFAGVSADIVFAVDNPNALGVDLAKLDYQLTVDNHPFVAGASDRPLHVPANGAGELALPVSFKFVELAQALASIFAKKTVPFTISTRLGFGTPLGVLTVPIDYAGTLPVPQLPSLSIANAGVGGLSLSGARVSVTLNVRNNNAFVLPLGPLRYALTVEGAPIVSAATAPTQLGAGATLPLVLSAELDFVRVGMGVFRALRSGAATLALDGSFDLAGYSMPVHLQTTIRP